MKAMKGTKRMTKQLSPVPQSPNFTFQSSNPQRNSSPKPRHPPLWERRMRRMKEMKEMREMTMKKCHRKTSPYPAKNEKNRHKRPPRKPNRRSSNKLSREIRR